MLELSERTSLDLNGAGLDSKAWEDNIGAQNLGNSKDPLMSSRTKHI